MAAEKLKYYEQPLREHKVHKEQRKTTVQHVQTKKSLFTKGEKFLYTFGVLVLTIGMIMVVNFSSSIDSLNRDLQGLNNDIQRIKVENTTLEAQVKELSKPSRILSTAKENGLNIQNATVKRASNTN